MYMLTGLALISESLYILTKKQIYINIKDDSYVKQV